jgi:hypothetical protein
LWPRSLAAATIRSFLEEPRRRVSLFVDHSQIVQLECLRSDIWETKVCGDAWSRTKKNDEAQMTNDEGSPNA